MPRAEGEIHERTDGRSLAGEWRSRCPPRHRCRVCDAGSVGLGPSLREHFGIARIAVEQPAIAVEQPIIAVPEHGRCAEGRVRP